MPATLPEWAFFAFFVIGSLGGWVLLSVLAYRPKPKTKPAKKRQRASKRIQKERL